MVVQKLLDLGHNEAFLKMSVEELNGDLKRKTAPLETEAGQIKKRSEEIEREIGRYVKALGQGKLSIERLEAEIDGLEADKQALRRQYDHLKRKINESAARDYNAEILQRTLRASKCLFCPNCTRANRSSAVRAEERDRPSPKARPGDFRA